MLTANGMSFHMMIEYIWLIGESTYKSPRTIRLPFRIPLLRSQTMTQEKAKDNIQIENREYRANARLVLPKTRSPSSQIPLINIVCSHG